MDDRFKDALIAYRMVIETSIDTFKNCKLLGAATDPQVLSKIVGAAEQAMWLVMDGGGLRNEEDGGTDD